MRKFIFSAVALVALCIGLNAAYDPTSGTGGGNVFIATNNVFTATNTFNDIFVNKDIFINDTSPNFTTGVVNVAGARYIHTLGTSNIWMGRASGNGTTLTTATRNVFIGDQVATNITTFSDGVIIGWQAGRLQRSSASSVIIGSEAGNAMTTVGNLVAIGYQAAQTVGNACTMIGTGTGLNAMGADNTFVGFQAGGGTGTASSSGVGENSGIRMSIQGCFLGYNAGQNASMAITNVVCIGANSYVVTPNTMALGAVTAADSLTICVGTNSNLGMPRNSIIGSGTGVITNFAGIYAGSLGLNSNDGLKVDGNTTLGDASSDTLTFNASTLAIPNGLNIGSGILNITSGGTNFMSTALVVGTNALSALPVISILTGVATLNFASALAGGQEDLPITVSGVTTNDSAMLGVPFTAASAGGAFTAFTSNSTVYVRFSNATAGVVDPASAQFRATVIRY